MNYENRQNRYIYLIFTINCFKTLSTIVINYYILFYFTITCTKETLKPTIKNQSISK